MESSSPDGASQGALGRVAKGHPHGHDRPTVQPRAQQLFTRYELNPILTADGWPYSCNSVFNPAAARLDSGETVLLVRVEDYRGFSHLTVARSADGFTDWQIDAEPTFVPSPAYDEERWGIEDARAVWLGEKGAWAVTYTAYSEDGPLVALALTEDFRTFERMGALMPPDDKNAALFPRKIDGRWMLLHRPTSSQRDMHPHIWASFSLDLQHWSQPHSVLRARPGAWWDHERIGIASPPIETDEGWLLLYHGVRAATGGDLYRVGLALLDLDDPTQVLLRGEPWIFGAREPYERHGDVPNTVFPCGHVLDRETGELRLYYGAADTCVAVATAPLDDLLDWILDVGIES